MTQPPVAILIVTFRSEAVIRDCVAAALRTGAEVLVIDNSPGDGTAEAAREAGARVLANSVNRGFAAAVNQGVEATTQPFLLLLNPDAVLQTGISPLVHACEQPYVAAASGLLLGPDGQPQRGFTVRRFPTPLALLCELVLINRVWPSNPVNWRFRCLGEDLACSSDVEQPAGAFLLFRRDAWQRLHGFDPGFFPLWFEDVDFCKRLRDSGARIRYEPTAVALHRGAHSIESLPPGTATLYWYRSLLRYATIHFRVAGKILICLGVIAGCVLRWALGDQSRRTPAMRETYYSVCMLALRSIWRAKPLLGEALL